MAGAIDPDDTRDSDHADLPYDDSTSERLGYGRRQTVPSKPIK